MKIALAIDKKITIFAKNIIMTNEDIDRNLVNSIKNNTLVIFTGAGVTRYLGMPDWRGFVKNCFKELSQEKIFEELDVRNEPGEILDAIKDSQDRTRIKNLVLEKFKVSPGADCWYHKRLLLLSSKIITTNFDDAFEVAFRQLFKKQIDVAIPKNNMVAFAKKRDNLIIKLHGSTSSPDDCAIFSNDYKEIYENDPYHNTTTVLEWHLREYDFLFLGYSFHDDKIVELMKKLYPRIIDHRNYLLTDSLEPFKNEKFNFLVLRKFDYDKQKTLAYLDSLIYKAYSREINDKNLSEELAEIDLFLGIDPISIFYHILRNAEKKTLREGEYLCHADEIVNSFWIIISGTITAIKKGEGERVNSICRSKYSPIGELGFLHNWEKKEDNQIKRSSDLKASEDTTVLEINQKLINNLEYKDQLTFWTNFAKVLANKLRETNHEII